MAKSLKTDGGQHLAWISGFQLPATGLHWTKLKAERSVEKMIRVHGSPIKCHRTQRFGLKIRQRSKLTESLGQAKVWSRMAFVISSILTASDSCAGVREELCLPVPIAGEESIQTRYGWNSPTFRSGDAVRNACCKVNGLNSRKSAVSISSGKLGALLKPY